METIVKNPSLFIPLFFFLSVLLPGPYAGQIYKWVDENGKVHFGDRPKPEHEATKVKVKKGNSISAPKGERLRKQQLLLEHFERKRTEKKEAEKKQEAKQAQFDAGCRNLKTTLQNYENSRAIYIEKPDGTQSYLSNSERRVEMERLRNMIAQHCR